MKRVFISLLTLTLALLFWGCAGGKKVATLQEQVVQERSEKEALKAEVDFLRKNLSEYRAANDSLKALLEQPQAAVAQPPPEPEAPPEPIVQTLPEPMPPPEDLPVVNSAADFQRSYERALALFRERQYAQAAESFTALLESNRTHRLSSNCQFWLGECLYAQKQYENALAEFQKVLAYPYTTKADAAQFKMAMCYLQMDKNAAAREEFNRLIAAYPNSEYVARARAQLDKIP